MVPITNSKHQILDNSGKKLKPNIWRNSYMGTILKLGPIYVYVFRRTSVTNTMQFIFVYKDMDLL